jgi:hypothetical protein
LNCFFIDATAQLCIELEAPQCGHLRIDPEFVWRTSTAFGSDNSPHFGHTSWFRITLLFSTEKFVCFLTIPGLLVVLIVAPFCLVDLYVIYNPNKALSSDALHFVGNAFIVSKTTINQKDKI